MSAASNHSTEIKFGTDGWRAVMARDFTFANVRTLAQAAADFLKTELEKPMAERKVFLKGPVLVCYDRRFQSESYAAEIAGVMAANGFKTILSDQVLPTPALSMLTRKEKGIGFMVTASHNPPAYNGVKIKWDGRAALPPVTLAVESFLSKSQPPAAPGTFKTSSFKPAYLAYLRSKVDMGLLRSGLKKPVFVDYLHGAGAGLIEELIGGKRVIALHSGRDPLFGGVNPEPIEENLRELSKRVAAENSMGGLALDGDADRFAAVDEKGEYLSPCRIFPMLISYLVAKRKIKGKIVQSVSLGYLSKRVAKAHGLEFEEFPVGFKFVAEELAAGRAAICAEESGGYAWRGCMPERDGPLTALTVLEMCLAEKKTLSQLWHEVESAYGKSHFKRVDIKLHKPVADKGAFAQKIAKRLPKKILGSAVAQTLTFDGLKIILDTDHWLLMRPSGTEPLMRLYAETDSKAKTEELLALGRKWVGPNVASGS